MILCQVISKKSQGINVDFVYKDLRIIELLGDIYLKNIKEVQQNIIRK